MGGVGSSTGSTSNADTEEYNGTSWTGSNTMATGLYAVYNSSDGGTQTAAYAAAGADWGSIRFTQLLLNTMVLTWTS